MKRAAKALIRNNQGKILVLYRSQTHPRLAHDLDLPGGLIDYGESVVDGLMREIVEETGVVLDISEQELRHVWRPTLSRRRFIYEVRDAASQPVSISWEHEAYAWLTDEEFIAHPAIDGFMHRAQDWLRLHLRAGLSNSGRGVVK